MCEQCCDKYIVFPPIFFGGPSGDFFVDSPTSSARWYEYRLLSFTSGSGSPNSRIVVSTRQAPLAANYSGAVTLSDQNFVEGYIYRLPTTSDGQSFLINSPWTKINNSNRRVFARFDVAGSNSAYVTLQFRARIIDVIPGPTPTVPPELEQQMNIQRNYEISKRLGKEMDIRGTRDDYK